MKAGHQGLGPSAKSKMEAVHNDLHAWNCTVLKGPGNRLKKAQRELENLMRAPFSDKVKIKQKELLVLIENLLDQEEVYWTEQGHVNWLHRGDRNTKYFTQFASARRRRNLIKKLRNNENGWVEGNDKLNPLIRDYFGGLFNSELVDVDNDLMQAVKPRVTTEMNILFTSLYSREDVWKALFHIGDMKAPGSDGLHAIFFKRFWHILGEELTDEVLYY